MKLNTAEKFLLLAKHPEKFWYKISEIHLNYGIIGSILIDLSLKKSLEIKEKCFHVNTKFEYKDKEYPGFERISDFIINSKKSRKPKYWIQKFARKSRIYKWEFFNGLEKKRLVRIENRKFLFIPYRRCYLVDSRTRNKLIDHLRDSVLYKKKKSEEDMAILGMVEACKMHKIISRDRHEVKMIKKELKTLLKDSPISQIVDDTIKQVQIAITIAIASSVAASTAASTAGR